MNVLLHMSDTDSVALSECQQGSPHDINWCIMVVKFVMYYILISYVTNLSVLHSSGVCSVFLLSEELVYCTLSYSWADLSKNKDGLVNVWTNQRFSHLTP